VVSERGWRLGVDVPGRNTLAPTARLWDVKHQNFLKFLILIKESKTYKINALERLFGTVD